MKKKLLAFIFMVFAITAFADPFTPGNIVVVRIGTGATPLTAAAQAVFLDEYTPCGNLVQSIALPIAVSGTHKRLTLPMYDVTEGYLTLSRKGQSLVLAGYDADPGTAAVSTSTSASVKRTIAVIGMDGTVNTTTALSDAFSGAIIRSAVADSNSIWMTGGSQGVRYATLGSATSTLIASVTGRYISIIDSGLYLSSTSGSIRMATVGSGLPVASLQTVTALPGFPVTGSPCQYYLADRDGSVAGADVLYVADDGAKALSKYSLVSGTWVSNGSIGLATDIYRGLTGKVDGGNVVLYSIRRNINNTKGGSQLVTITDTAGYNDTLRGLFTLVATADTNTIMRGVVLLPDAPPAARMASQAKTQNNSLELFVSPNPANDQLHIRFTTHSAVQPAIFISNAAGQLITSIPSCNTKSNQLYLSVKGWPKGIYYVTLITGKIKATKKLLIQ